MSECASISRGAWVRRKLTHGLRALSPAKRRLKAEWLTQSGVDFLRATGIDRGDTVVDFGCGTGAYSIPASLLVGRDGLVVSVDVHTRRLSRLMRSSTARGLGNIRAVVNIAEMAPFFDGRSCRAVLLYDMLHFMDGDTRKGLYRAFYKKLGTDGFLSVFPKHLKGDSRSRYFRNMTLDDVSKEIEESGFRLRETRQADLWHNSNRERGTVLTFHKVTEDAAAPTHSSASNSTVAPGEGGSEHEGSCGRMKERTR